MKKYVDIIPTRDENAICLETGYSEGGHNWYNSANERRGYYLYCTPVNITQRCLPNGREYNTISQVFGKGNKLLLKEVTRRSKKAEAEAEIIAEEKANWLLEKVLDRYGLQLTDIEQKNLIYDKNTQIKSSLEQQIDIAENLKTPIVNKDKHLKERAMGE